MKISKLIFLISVLVYAEIPDSLSQNNQNNEKVSVKWHNEKPRGNVTVINGDIESISILQGKGKVHVNQFSFNSDGSNILNISLKNVKTGYGSGSTLVSVHNGGHSFSFLLRDVTKEFPVYIPEYNVMVCMYDDYRSYNQIEEHIKSLGLQTKIRKIESEPEESWDSAAVHTRKQTCPIWLGISRDIRIFELGSSGETNIITPRKASSSNNIPDANIRSVNFSYLSGRGQGVEQRIVRRLEDGVLPILHSTQIDEDIEYISTAFVTLESTPLDGKSKIGTDFLVADYYSAGHMFTEEQQNQLKLLLHNDSTRTEETVLYLRTEAVNRSSVPRYAFFRTIRPGSGWWEKFSYSYDRKTGLSGYSPDRIFGISKLNGDPLPNEEISVLLKPDEKAIFEFRIPNSPISKERALRLADQSFDKKHTECRNFWNAKLDKAAQIKLPEKRIEEMIRAGLLHLDLITYGIDPDQTLAPCVGVYSPIGTESSPIIQFFNSMGFQDNARRSMMYFLDKQHEDGMIQNFGGYMGETGAALWTMGEYYRYTFDTALVRQIEPKLLKACDFLIKWRQRNKLESLRLKGYGMIDGKVADPEDQYHQFMLNGYAFLGISRVAEMLNRVDKVNSNRLKNEAESWKQDIRASFFESMAGSPVIPSGDGTWSPTVPPWTEAKSLRLLYLNPEPFMSHGTFTVSDAMLGPLYLVFCEVFDPKEQASAMMLKYHTELFYLRNAAFSQPYYSRHNWVQLKLGMVKPFLKTYYNTFSALADRETYTFWEHLYQVSVHKTHEEAWFLMETRWMLYLEEGQTLKLLPGIPEKWMEDGKTIELKNAASYFGPLSLEVRSSINKGSIEATIECNSERKPLEVSIRIPHPGGKKPVKVSGGIFDNFTESVIIKPFSGNAKIKIEY
jgi:hypothetical protein